MILPSSTLDTSDGADTEQGGGGGIIFFLPGFSLLSISGAKRRKDGGDGLRQLLSVNSRDGFIFQKQA